MRTVIIGGGACGASTAARIRRLDESAEIIVLEKTGEISIANCGLPYYTSGVINDREKMLVSSPEKFREWFNINVKLNTEVIIITSLYLLREQNLLFRLLMEYLRKKFLL